MARKNRLLTGVGSKVLMLDERINPGVVTNTSDYWLGGPPLDPASKAIPGSLRYEIDAAIKAGGGHDHV